LNKLYSKPTLFQKQQSLTGAYVKDGVAEVALFLIRLTEAV
jgi:hypothetical protein